MSQFYSGSLPQTNYPVNSKGHTFSTVQACVDDLGGDGFVYVPPGTWSEAVTVSDNNVLLFGAGRSSYIDGGTTGTAITVTGDNCIIRDIRVATTAGGGNSYMCIQITGGTDNIVDNVYVSASDYRGINQNTTNSLVLRCHVAACDNEGIYVGGRYSRVVGCYVDDAVDIHQYADDSTVVSNYITGACDIHIDAENCVWDSNRNPGGLTDNSGTSTVGDNDET